MNVYEFGPFTLDAGKLLLMHDGTPLALGPKVVETLLALIEAPGDIHAKSALLERIWPEGYVEEANLAQNIYVLRKTLRAHWDVDAIETIPRRGYRFIAPVSLVERRIAVPAHKAVRPAWLRPVALGSALLMAVMVLTGFGLARRQPVAPAAASGLSETGSRLYAIGRYYWNTRTRDGVLKSLGYFRAVVDSDPRDPHGYAGLAQANSTIADYGYGALKDGVYLQRAREYARKALELDAKSSDAYAALGSIDINEHHGALARAELERAIALDPKNGAAHQWYGAVLLEAGATKRAFDELKIAAELDPLNVAATAWLGSAAYLNHHFGEAIAYARQTMDLSPQRSDVLMTMGLSYEAEGDYPRALAAFTTFKRSRTDCRAEASALLAHLYARMHRPSDARAELAYALAHSKDVDPADLAFALNAVGERREAMAYFNRARKMPEWTSMLQDPRNVAIPPEAG